MGYFSLQHLVTLSGVGDRRSDVRVRLLHHCGLVNGSSSQVRPVIHFIEVFEGNLDYPQKLKFILMPIYAQICKYCAIFKQKIYSKAVFCFKNVLYLMLKLGVDQDFLQKVFYRLVRKHQTHYQLDDSWPSLGLFLISSQHAHPWITLVTGDEQPYRPHQ